MCEWRRNMLRVKSRNSDLFLFQSLVKSWITFLEDEKIVPTLKTFFVVVSFFDAEISAHDSIDGTVRILERQGADAWFFFGADALLDVEGLDKVK